MSEFHFMTSKDDNNEIEVQDSEREDELARIFGLKKNPDRLGYDAFDEDGNPYELKSTTQSGVGTGRDVGLHTLEKYRACYWIIGMGTNRASGFEWEEIYFLPQEIIEESWTHIQKSIEPDIQLGKKVLKSLEGELLKSELERVEYLILRRGATKNNPKISLKVVKNGIRIDMDRPKEHLRELVKKYPLSSS